MITVSRPIPGGFIQGGGSLVNSNSSGLIKGTNGTKTNFQFDVTFNKKLTNPQGKATITVSSYYRSDGTLDSEPHTNVITSNAISLLNLLGTTASFSSKANLVEEIPGGTIAVEGGATFQLEMTDGNPDKLAITLYRKAGGIWFSSNWVAVTTVKQTIQDGEITVGAATKSATIEPEIATAIAPVVIEPTIKAYPNPFTEKLNIEFSSAINGILAVQ